MAGTLSTLGLGSSGVLSNDLIDQLRNADEAGIIKPIENKQKSLTLQQAGLVGLKDSVSDLEDLATSLSDLALYQTKKTEQVGDSITIDATSSAKSQSLDINVTQLATRDIHQSSGYASKTDALGAGSMTIDLPSSGESFTIDISAEDTLETLADKISDATDGTVSASILNVGGDQPYTMILKSTDTGTDNSFTISGNLAFTEISDAKNAELTVDNIAITRQSNELSDVVEGATITLSQTGDTRVEISQDDESIIETMNSFVEKYNELLTSISTLTNYDADTKVAGVFQGSSEIRNMMGPIKDIFSSTITSIGKMSEDFGLSTDQDGTLTFDSDTFSEALSKDSTEVKNFFIGEGAEEGIFRAVNSQFFDIATSSDGIFKTLDANYTEKESSLADTLERAQERLDSKYDIMQKKFAAYDSVISKLTNASDTLTSLIDAQNGDN